MSLLREQLSSLPVSDIDSSDIYLRVPELLAKSLQGLEDRKRNQLDSQAAPLGLTEQIVITEEETTKQGKPVTQMRRLDAAVANAVDFDLGDF